MPVPTYPSAITLADIQTEFGGSNPIGLNEYYAGGSYVGSGAANSTGTAIPSSGAINFLNFSGATAGRFWYHPRFPRTSANVAWQVSSRMDIKGGYLSFGGGYLYLPASYYPYMSGMKVGTGNTIYSRELTTGGTANTLTLTYTTTTSISPNTTFSIATTSVGLDTYIYRYYTANGTQTANANTTGLGGWFRIIATDTGYIKVQPGYNTANIVIAKWSGQGDTLDWYFSANLNSFISHGMTLFNSDSSRIICTIYKSTGTVPMIQVLSASDGSLLHGYKVDNTSVGIPIGEASQTDTANGFCVRWSGYTNTVSRLVSGTSSITESYRTTVPSGNTVVLVTHDPTGNAYAAMKSGTNLFVTKIDTSGAALWTREFYNTSSQVGRWDMQAQQIAADGEGYVIIIRADGQNFDTQKQSWESTGISQGHILRLKNDGAGTGTYANLSYISKTTQTLTTASAFGLTSNALSNVALLSFPTALTANTKANVAFLRTNSSMDFIATTIT